MEDCVWGVTNICQLNDNKEKYEKVYSMHNRTDGEENFMAQNKYHHNPWNFKFLL